MKKNKISYLLLDYGLLIALLFIIIVVSFISENFFSVNNMLNILRQVSVTGVMALGVSIVIIAGHMDLSIGSILSLSGVVVMTMVNDYRMDGLGVIMALGAGGIVGLINGVIIAAITGKKARTGESFIITYGMQTAIAAFTLLVTNGVYINGKGGGFHSQIGKGMWPIIIFVGLAVLFYLMMNKTPFGRTIYFIGNNEPAARMSGVNVKFYTVAIFVIAGFCAGLAGVILSSRVNAASSTAGNGMELDAIAAVVVGGTALTGGKGGIGRTVLGVVVLGVLQNALHILNVTTYPQMIIRGSIIVLAVLFDVLAGKIKEKGGKV